MWNYSYSHVILMWNAIERYILKTAMIVMNLSKMFDLILEIGFYEFSCMDLFII